MSASSSAPSSGTSRPSAAPRPARSFRRFLVDLLAATLLAAVVVAGVLLRDRRGGVIEVRDDEVAIGGDHRDGSETVVDTPGYLSYVPWLQEVHVLQRSPTEFRMEGESPQSAVHSERLLVRASDGSSFWFGSLTLQYALRKDAAVRAFHELRRPGSADARMQGAGDENAEDAAAAAEAPLGAEAVRAYARSVLRDEFGRFSAEEVVRPDNIQAAALASRRRLDELLRPHGLEILELPTPKPQFDRSYEETIERRKVANQEVERLRVQVQQLAQERERRMANVRQDVALERLKLEGVLRRDLASVERDAIRERSLAEARYEDAIGHANADTAMNLERAGAMRERFATEIETLRRHAAALEEHGEGAVRAAWIKRLPSIPFRLRPYQEDPLPARVSVGNDLAALERTNGGAR